MFFFNSIDASRDRLEQTLQSLEGARYGLLDVREWGEDVLTLVNNVEALKAKYKENEEEEE